MNRRNFFQIAAGIATACKVGLPAVPPTIEKKNNTGVIATVTGWENPADRFLEPEYSGAKTRVQIEAFIPSREPGTKWYGNEGVVTFWISYNDGPWKWLGWNQQDHPRQTFNAEIWRPIDGDQISKVACALGPHTQSGILPAGAVQSASFFLARVGAPSPHAVTNARTTEVKWGGNFEYWGLPDGVFWRNPERTADSNFFYTALSVQCVDASGRSAPPEEVGAERLVGQFSDFGQIVFRDIDRWMFSPYGSPFVNMRFRLYCVSRSAQSWKDRNFSTLQTTCWDGAAYRDVFFGTGPPKGWWTWNGSSWKAEPAPLGSHNWQPALR